MLRCALPPRVPLLRALDMVRPRLLLAVGVGLGKTIPAWLIAAELLVRRRAQRVLIVCPLGPLLRQWERVMRVWFGLRVGVSAAIAGLRVGRLGLGLGGRCCAATGCGCARTGAPGRTGVSTE